MTEAQPEGPLSLGEALSTWCPRWLVGFVAEAEKRFAIASLRQAGRPSLSQVRFTSSSTNWFRPTSRDEHCVEYEGLWQKLLADWRRKLETDEIVLIGVQTKPTEQEQRSRIPGVWATDLEFDFLESAVAGVNRRYVAVQAWRGGLPKTASVTVDDSQARETITPATVRELSDEELLSLFEEYARRVVEEFGSDLTMPVKPSFIPIIGRKMERRFKTGEAAPSLKAEANALEAWIRTKVNGHQVPAADTIERRLGERYGQLKRISKADIR